MGKRFGKGTLEKDLRKGSEKKTEDFLIFLPNLFSRSLSQIPFPDLFPRFLSQILFVVLFPLLLFQSSYASEQSLYKLCISAFEKGDLIQAQRYAELFIKSYPNSERSEAIQFISASSEPDFISAESQYLKIIQKNGKWAAKSRLELAQRYFLKGDFDNAVSHCRSTIENRKQNKDTDIKTQIKAHYLLCKSLMAKRLYDEAILELKQLQDIPESQISGSDITAPDIRFKIAECYFQKSDYDKAIETYRNILEKYPKSRWIYLTQQRELECQQKRKGSEEKTSEKTDQGNIRQFEPLKDSKNEGGNFSIQVGSFTERTNALELIDFLKERGYEATLILPDTNEPKIFRVNVGKFKSAEEAKREAQKLRRGNGLPVKIMFQGAESETNETKPE